MPGRLVHFELQVVDAARASEFFRALFDWHPEPRMDGSFYLVPGTPSGGIMTAPGGASPARIYFDVDDIEAAVSCVRELGGEPGEIAAAEGFGRWSHCVDDQGTQFGLYELPRQD